MELQSYLWVRKMLLSTPTSWFEEIESLESVGMADFSRHQPISADSQPTPADFQPTPADIQPTSADIWMKSADVGRKSAESRLKSADVGWCQL